MQRPIRVLIAGGGTGGHIFPALAVADEIRNTAKDARIVFIGTKKKIESRVVPEAGYEFKSIWIKGFNRKSLKENLLFPLRLIVSMIQATGIAMKLKPDVAIGSGGYVSGPAVVAGWVMGAKVILLEQNSYPGITTRLLERFATEVHISYQESVKYFRHPEKVFYTGNPVRTALNSSNPESAREEMGLKSDKKTVLILGGSLGAGSMNRATAGALQTWLRNGMQVIWQTGQTHFGEYKHQAADGCVIAPFFDTMANVYAAADLVVSRAGATALAELAMLGKALVVVPSPNVAENHQYHNAKSLSDGGGAVLIEDKSIERELEHTVLELLHDDNRLEALKENIKRFAKPEAAKKIAEQAVRIAL